MHISESVQLVFDLRNMTAAQLLRLCNCSGRSARSTSTGEGWRRRRSVSGKRLCFSRTKQGFYMALLRRRVCRMNGQDSREFFLCFQRGLLPTSLAGRPGRANSLKIAPGQRREYISAFGKLVIRATGIAGYTNRFFLLFQRA